MRRRLVGAAALVAVVLLALLSWTRYAEGERAAELARERPAEVRAAPAATRDASVPAAVSKVPLRIAFESRSPNQPLWPLPPPGSPLKDALPALKAQVAEGDAAAACRIAFELDRCAKLPGLRRAPSFWENALDQLTAESRAKRAWYVANAQRIVAQAEATCAGLPEQELAYTFDYALAAALAGNRQARWLVTSFPVGLDFARPERTLEGWARWRDHIGTIMEQAIEAGDPRVMRIASNAYVHPHNGFRIFPADPVRGVALQMAVARSAHPSYRTESANVGHLAAAEALSAEQLEAARQLSATFSIAQAPEGGIDWSRGMMPSADGTECERER